MLLEREIISFIIVYKSNFPLKNKFNKNKNFMMFENIFNQSLIKLLLVIEKLETKYICIEIFNS